MKPSKALTVVVVLVVVSIGIFAATAGVFPGHHRRGGMGFQVPGLKTFIELNLSESQRAQILSIIETHQKERQDTVDSLLEARKLLLKAVHAQEFDEDKIRKAHRKVSSMQEEVFISRAKMIAEIKAVLNPEQIELLRERRTQRIEKMRGRLEKWLQNPGE